MPAFSMAARVLVWRSSNSAVEKSRVVMGVLFPVCGG